MYEHDGSVYIEAEGEDRALNDFIDWCKKGPPAARVEHVDVMDGEVKNFDSFTIKRYT